MTATDVKILDGTPEYPLSIVGSLNAARARFDNWTEPLKTLTDEMIQRRRAELPEGFDGKRTAKKREHVWQSWYDEVGELEVVILSCLMEQTQGPDRQIKSKPCAYDPKHGSAPCVMDDPEKPPRPIPQFKTYGYGMGAKYRFNRQGRLIFEERYLPRSHVWK